MLLTNVWYIAEASENVTDKPVKVTMLGREFVLFRDGAGKAVCLSNTCCHRGASLAQGRCQPDGTVSCPFHGWRYDASGRCTLIPSAADPGAGIPANARVDSYPTQERHGYIWAFLGDRVEEAHPVFDMPEDSDPAFRRVSFTDTWKTNVHWMKMVDLDQVHLHIVHGIPLNEENPSRPSAHSVEWLPTGFRTHLVSQPPPRGGSWAQLRQERTKVNSYLTFYLPGFTLYGKVEIGMPGSNFVNVFYSMSTPVDEENTRLFLVAFRNFMLEPDKDKDHLERNLRNVYQDKAIAEGHRPRRRLRPRYPWPRAPGRPGPSPPRSSPATASGRRSRPPSSPCSMPWAPPSTGTASREASRRCAGTATRCRPRCSRRSGVPASPSRGRWRRRWVAASAPSTSGCARSLASTPTCARCAR